MELTSWEKKTLEKAHRTPGMSRNQIRLFIGSIAGLFLCVALVIAGDFSRDNVLIGLLIVQSFATVFAYARFQDRTFQLLKKVVFDPSGKPDGSNVQFSVES